MLDNKLIGDCGRVANAHNVMRNTTGARMSRTEYFMALSHNHEIFISSVLKKRIVEASQILENYLLKLPGQRTLGKEPSKRSRFFAQVYKGYIEISDSFERLRSYEVYIGRYGYSGTAIKPAQHLVCLVENYMNEIYVLNLRMNNYGKKLERLYKNDPNTRLTKSIVLELKDVLKEAYGFIIDARGAHIHRERYSDERLNRLQLLETLATTCGNENSDNIRDAYKLEYKELRKTWKKMIKIVNDETEKILDRYFDALHPAVFTRGKNMRIPRLRDMPNNIESKPRVKRRKSR